MYSGCGSEDELLPSERPSLPTDSHHNSGVLVHSNCENVGKIYLSQTTIATHDVSHRTRYDFPTKRRKLAVLLSCWFLHVLAYGCSYGMGVIFVELIREFESPRTQTALVQSVFTAIMAGAGFIFTPFVLKYGFGICLTLATLAATLGFIVAAWAIDLTMVIIFVGLISGLGTSVFYLCGFVAVSSMFGANSGVPLVFITLGASTGQLVCPYLFEILITAYDWRGTYFIIGAINLHGREQQSNGEPGVEDALDRTKRSTGVFDSTLFKDPMLMIFLFNCFILGLTGMFESWFIVDVMVLKGYERGDGSFMLVLVGTGSMVARMIAVGLKLILKIPTVAHWLYVCLMIAGCHAVVVSSTGYWPLFSASLVYGFSFGMIYAQVPVIVLEISGLDRYPRAVGLLNFTFGAADFLLGIMGGLVNDLTGSYDWIFYIATGVAIYVAVASIILAYFVHMSKVEAARAGHNEKTPLISKHMNGYQKQSQVSIKIGNL